MNTNAKRLFLLGGHDLEMLEIRKLLQDHGCKELDAGELEAGDFDGCRYLDKNLTWGAKVSDYSECLDIFGNRDDLTIYGIELSEDLRPPANYRPIDHHNERSGSPGSLEQIAELFGISLDRWQRLVAANDTGHIPALQALCATEEEIERIRNQDRQAQGVTEEEEQQAKELASRCAEEETSPCVDKKGYFQIQTDLSRFSPLVDRLYVLGTWPLLVYNPQKPMLNFYGTSDQIGRLIEAFQDACNQNTAYYGGKPLGYFGLAPEYFQNRSMEDTLVTIEKTLAKEPEETLHSYHIFMFPFLIRNQENLPEIDESHWIHKTFRLDSKENYNEYIYFHPFVRDILYEIPTDARGENDSVSRYYEYEKERGDYIIEVQEKTYTLDLDGIALRLFKNGVGILSFHLKNTRYRIFEDLLKINDFGRRIFPQFLGNGLVAGTKNSLLAESLTLAFEGEEPIRECFDRYASLDKIEKIPNRGIRLPNFIERLLGEAFGPEQSKKIEPIIDDRMFTLCHYMNDAVSQRLTRYDENEKRYAYECSQDWHRFVFIDGTSSTCQNRAMLEDLLSKATYPRWSDYSTLFGITRYSFMLLTGNNEFAKNVLNLHLRTMYYQMATLLLAYRAMILVFSHRVTSALDDADTVRSLQKSYLEFTNRIYFKELTPQEQGIGLFDLARNQMRLDDHLRELDHDINELNSFKQMELDREINDQGLTLNRIAAIFLPPSLLAGIFGMNIVDFSQNTTSMLTGAILIVFSALFGFLLITDKANKKNKSINIFGIILLLLFIFALICMPTNLSETIDKNSTQRKGNLCQIIK